MGYSGFPDLQRLQAEENGPFYDACLLERVVPLAAGLAERLDAGIDVLDISRGQGHAVNLLAGAFWGRGEGPTPWSSATPFSTTERRPLCTGRPARRCSPHHLGRLLAAAD